jgi:hypothetical protein
MPSPTSPARARPWLSALPLLGCTAGARGGEKVDAEQALACDGAAAVADGLPYPTVQAALDGRPAALRLCPGLLELGVDVLDDLILDGGGLELAAPAGRSALRVLGGAVHVHDLTLIGGDGDLDDAFDEGQRAIGGVVNAWRARALRLDRVALRGGLADWGGGLMGPEDGDLALTDVEITGSTALRLGGGAWCRGGRLTRVRIAENTGDYVGGLAVRRGEELGPGELVLDEVEIRDNRARVQGGGLHLAGPVEATLGVAVVGNHAEQGGGLLLIDHRGGLDGGELRGNTASAGGAGAQVVRGQTTWAGAVIADNVVTNEGLGDLEGVGGGVWGVEAGLTLKSAEVSGNRGAWGAGLMVAGRAAPPEGGAELRLVGARFADHAPEASGATGATIAVSGARLSGTAAIHNGVGRMAGGLWTDAAAVALQATWSGNRPGDTWDAASGPLPSVRDGALLRCTPVGGCAAP